MKQTAVEWLQELELQRDLTLEDYEQAKAMEKQQIESAYRKGYTESSWGRHSNSEQYYNKTYKSE